VLGLALLAIGAVALWAAFTGRATNVLAALKMDLPKIGAGNAIVTPPSESGPGGTNDAARAAASDIGTHTALTDGGLAYAINKAYANMTDQEKHDANNFAHNQSNLASGT
jgi:hypothetical protein